MVTDITVGDDFLSIIETHKNMFLTERFRRYGLLELQV